jgi:hypothetical protein
LAKREKTDLAEAYLSAIHEANEAEADGEPWCFPEYIHGKELTPGGTRHQAWSAAGAIIGQRALEGEKVFRIDAQNDG